MIMLPRRQILFPCALLLSNGLDDGLSGLGDGGAVGVVFVELGVGGLSFGYVFHAA